MSSGGFQENRACVPPVGDPYESPPSDQSPANTERIQHSLDHIIGGQALFSSAKTEGKIYQHNNG
jgi:hypothetical protein